MKHLVLMLLLCLSGCHSLKRATGDYVVDSVQKSLLSDLDEALNQRGLSREQIKRLVDSDGNKTLDRKEIAGAVAGSAKDALLLEVKGLVDSEMAKSSGVWNWLLGLVAAYLSKQVYSIRKDRKRLKRLEVLEMALQKDLDGDGVIGKAPEKQSEVD